MDRLPLPPPFDVGTRLRYKGTAHTYTHGSDGVPVDILAPGMVVSIEATAAGRRGSLRSLPPAYQDDEESGPTLDRTTDGHSIYYVRPKGKASYGRCIWPADAHEWQALPD